MPEPVVPLDPLDPVVVEGRARRQDGGHLAVRAVDALVLARRGNGRDLARPRQTARLLLCLATPSARQEVSP